MVGYGKRTLRNGAGGTSNLVLPHQLAGEQVWEGDRQCSNAGRWLFARTRAKVPKEHALRLDQELCGCCGFKLRMSAIRLSSGRERAFIFRIRFVRCTFTVDSATPISWAICLFRRPAVT
jgi:hypothetical protein